MPKILEHAKNILRLRRSEELYFGCCTKSSKCLMFLDRLMFVSATPMCCTSTLRFK